jgi:hypothetical protein
MPALLVIQDRHLFFIYAAQMIPFLLDENHPFNG